MKANQTQMAICACWILVGTLVYAGPEGQGYMGVLLDPQPLPTLLAKHLNLSPDQGLRIKNVNRHSPADRAGLERDDIIIAVEGHEVLDYTMFVDAVRDAGAHNTIKLEIIHEGRRNTLDLKLGEPTDHFDPKFPPEPAAVEAWRPGKMFHFDTNADGWIEIDEMDMNPVKPRIDPRTRTDIRRYFKEHYRFHYGDCDPACIVTIDGDPHDSGTDITVEKGDNQYRTTVDDMDALPEHVQGHAKRALKQARQTARKRTRAKALKQHSQALDEFVDEHAPEDWQNYTDKVLDRVKVFIDKHEKPLTLRGSKKLEEIESHLKDLTDRMEKLEHMLQKKLERVRVDEGESEVSPKDELDHSDEAHESASRDDSQI